MIKQRESLEVQKRHKIEQANKERVATKRRMYKEVEAKVNGVG